MIVYNATKTEFNNDVIFSRISDIILKNLRDRGLPGGGESEYRSWSNSLQYMRNALDDPAIPGEAEVAIEYQIPRTSKRVDCMIAGADKNGSDNVVIVELKQWAEVQKVDDWSKHSVLSDLRTHQPTAHPSYQAYSYKSLILNYCDMQGISYDSLSPCAYKRPPFS